MLPKPTGKNSSLKDEDLRDSVVQLVATHLSLESSGRLVNPTMVAEVLVYAATTGKSIHGVCEEMLDCADGNTIREYVNAQIRGDAIGWLEGVINQMLVANLPRNVRRGRWKVAGDLHDQPFYGKSPKLRAHACRGEAHAGTTWFFRIASLYVIAEGVRVTLAIRFVQPHDKLPMVLEGLLAAARPHMGGIECLFLDKGFASIEIYNLLERTKTPAIITCPIRGKAGGGTRKLCGPWHNRSVSHTFKSQEHGSKTVKIAVVYEYHPERKEARRNQWLLYVQILNSWSPKRCRDEYRRRFGIESSYRCLNQLRANTTSSNPALRFLFLALALVLQNAWTITRFHYCQVPRQGRAGRTIDEARFRLDRFRDFLRLAIERRLSPVTKIYALAMPLHV